MSFLRVSVSLETSSFLYDFLYDFFVRFLYGLFLLIFQKFQNISKIVVWLICVLCFVLNMFRKFQSISRISCWFDVYQILIRFLSDFA